MRLVPLIVLSVMGVSFILVRNLFSRFFLAIVGQIPEIKKLESFVLRWIPVLCIVMGVAFIAIGVLMAST